MAACCNACAAPRPPWPDRPASPHVEGFGPETNARAGARRALAVSQRANMRSSAHSRAKTKGGLAARQGRGLSCARSRSGRRRTSDAIRHPSSRHRQERSRERGRQAWRGQGIPWPDPSAYLPASFSCGGSNGNAYYCDPGLDRQMQQAERLELTNPRQAQAVWESVDHRLTNAAVWAPTVTTRDVELTSRRLHNYESNRGLARALCSFRQLV